MVVTVSLARGAVRAAADRHSRTSAETQARIDKVGLEPPATLRRFSEWFRKRKVIHEKDALLIAFGMVGRRKGRFSAYRPHFEEIDTDWKLRIHTLHVDFSPGQINAIEQNSLPVGISGHALERMFQRTNTIEWPVIRDCLAGATLFLNAVAGAYIKSGYKRCAIPAERGMLVGQILDGILFLRTFLPDSQLNPRWQSLYGDLLAFSTHNGDAINKAALVPDDVVGHSFGDLLKSGRHGWLERAYVPGDDPLEDAWRSKE